MRDRAPVAALNAAKIDEIFLTANQCHLPGAAVAIAIAGVPVYRKAFGLANIELPVALSPSMRMRIGSTTKHFVSLAYMLLCEAGLARLDDEIGKYLPELRETNRRVTMRQLMTHTSGIRDIFAISMLFHGAGRPVTDKEMLAYYERIDDVEFQPGTHWSYNNGGYVLITAAIERITGEPLEDVLRRRILEPVGMNDTMLRRWDSDFVPNSATLHMVSGAGYSRDYMGMEMSGAGGLVSTMDDMLRWLKHMDAPVIGSAKTWEVMKAPVRLARGASTGYGLGLITSTYRGVETLSHGGGVLGGSSQMIKVLSAKLDISVAVNRADLMAADLANKIIDACVEGLDAPQAAPPVVPRNGIFISPRSGRVAELIAHGDTQLVALDGASPLPMTMDAQGVLQLPAFMTFLQRQLTPSDSQVQLSEFADIDVMEQVQFDAASAEPAPAGTYTAEGLHVQITIASEPAGIRLRTVGTHGAVDYSLEPIGDGVWKAASRASAFPLSFVLTFDTDGLGFTVTGDRLIGIPFRRVPDFAVAVEEVVTAPAPRRRLFRKAR